MRSSRLAVLLALVTAIPAVAGAEETLDAQASGDRPTYGVGVRLRYVFLPQPVIDLFVDHSTSMSSVGVGAEFVRRKANLDIVVGLEWEDISPEDGLYLEQGDDPGIPGQYPDYVAFDKLGLLGLDVSFIWHTQLAPRFELRYGGGIGVAALLGDIVRYDTLCPPGTSADDLDDPHQCTRLPTYEDGLPTPVVPIVNVLLGFRYRISPNIAISLDAGFRDVFFAGLGAGYAF